MIWALAAFVIWALGWWINLRLANGAASENTGVRILIPAIFGLTVIIVWELLVHGFEINPVILPAPSAIAQRLMVEGPRLWADFQQTIIKGAMSGYLVGGLAAFGVAILADRSDFLTRGILPVGSFMAALPIVGTAPIFVKWLGSDWESKAAVVAVMVFFPILVNTVAGLRDTSSMQRDLMRTYGAPYRASFWRLKLPAALPFIFNGLKISTTLALVGAIVAEFFGSPTQGLGYRINTSAGRLELDMVWAAIVVSALSGGLFYAAVAALERRLTFWHPSQRRT